MKKFIKVLFILFFCIKTIDVKAEICDVEDMERQEVIASNVVITSEHVLTVLENETVSNYIIDIAGITEDIYIIDDFNNEYYYEDSSEGVITTTSSHGVKKYQIRSRYCADYLYETKSITLKKFNFYSLRDECKQDEFKDLDVCDEWYQGNISYEKFMSIIDEARVVEKEFDKRILVVVGVVVLFIIILLIIRQRRRGVLE